MRGSRLLLAVVLVSAVGASAAQVHDPAEASAGAPLNVVLILTDDQAFDGLAQMPFVNGRSDWIRFDNAFVNNPLCCPSRASILTGKYSHRTGVETNTHARNFNDRATIATWLDTAGYETGYVGKYLNNYPFDREAFAPPGWDHWRVPTTLGYSNFVLAEKRRTGNVRERVFNGQYLTDVLSEKATALVHKLAGNPFFMVFAPWAPHEPAEPAARHAAAFPGAMPQYPNINEADVTDKPPWIQDRELLDPALMDEKRRNQWRTLLAVDEAVASLYGALESEGVLENTVVIFMTDNGFSLGAHRLGKKQCPYEECIRTPFLVRYPGQPGRVESQLVSNVDVAPTIAAAAGLTRPRRPDGANLGPILQGGDPAWREEVLIHAVKGSGIPSAWWGLRSEHYKYVEYDRGDIELYDLQADPFELQNVAGTPAYAEIQQQLAERLAALAP